MMEAWWLDLPKKTNKPDKAPFAHLIIDGNKIPSGKFLLNHIFLTHKWRVSPSPHPDLDCYAFWHCNYWYHDFCIGPL